VERLNDREVLLTDAEILIEEIIDILMDQGRSASDAVILIRGAQVSEGLRSPTPELDKVLTPEFVLYITE
jgi:hypothetical protein